jgi:hypothetical protein
LFVKLTFQDKDLQRILAQHVRDALKLNITADDTIDICYEQDEDDSVTGVSIEFEASEVKAE